MHGLDGVAHELVPAVDHLVGEFWDAALVAALPVDCHPQHVLTVLHIADGLGEVAPPHALARSQVLFEVADGVDVTQDLHALAFQFAHAMVKRAGELLAVVDALCFLDLREREAEELEGEDAIEALLVASRIEALVLLAFGAGVQQALLVVVLDGAHGHAHAPGEFANGHQIIFVCRHAVLLSHAESQSCLTIYYRARRYVTVKCSCGDCCCFAATRWCRLSLVPTRGLGLDDTVAKLVVRCTAYKAGQGRSPTRTCGSKVLQCPVSQSKIA